MTKYLIEYSRVSSKKQVKGMGLEAQAVGEKLKNDLCSTYDLLPYPETFSDAGVSGFSISAKDRPSFSKLLKLLESGSVHPDSVLVISNIDRLSRSDIHSAASTLLQVTEYVKLYMVHDKRMFVKGDPNLLIDLIMTLVALERAHNESLSKSIRHKDNVRIAVQKHLEGHTGKNGKPLRIPSYYLPLWIKTVDKELFINEPVADLFREAIQRLIDGESVMKVYEWLKQHPHPKKGKHWTPDQVRKLHYKETLYGHCVMNVNGEEIQLPDYIEPIISKAQFLKLVEVRSRAGGKTKRPSKDVSILTGYGAAFCRCGCPMTTTMSKGRTRIQCSSVFSSGYSDKCSNPVRVEESYIMKFLNEAILAPVFKEELQPNDNKEQIQELTRELEKEQKLHDKFYSQYADTGEDFLLDLVRTKKAKLKEIEEQLDNLYVPVELDDLSALRSIPTDRRELRNIYKRILKSIKFYRLGRGKTLVTVITKYEFGISAMFVNGRRTKVASLSKDCQTEFTLEDDSKFKKFVDSGKLKKWLEK